MDAYELHDGRFIQERAVTTGAAELVAPSAVVPDGKVWTILGAYVTCSANETKKYWFAINATGSGRPIPVTRPVDAAIANATYQYFPLVTEGLELRMYPGQYLCAFRDSATAGSTLTLVIRYIETDLPFYSYEEPQKKVVRSQAAHGSVYRSSGGISSAPGGGGTGVDGGGGGHGHGGQPI